MSVKELLKGIIEPLTDKFPIKNIILFESVPDYSDNTKAVFDEMLKRGLNKDYQLIWICSDKDAVPTLEKRFESTENVRFIHVDDLKYKLYFRKAARAFIVCNAFLHRAKPEQYYIHLAHGCALKNASGSYSLPENCSDADVLTISEYMAPFDAYNLNCSAECMRALGYPRNDELFSHIDLHAAFPGYSFDKFIYWLPTYRQNKWGDRVHSDISMPIIYTAAEAEALNQCAKDKNVLIAVKVHQVQDISKVQEYNFSNLIFIKNDFFADKSFSNYQLLGSSDALISDYSSVYYDYLLCDKPIGLCFDDFEEYNKREGFTMDVNIILKGGVKLYNIDDLCAFVSDVADGNDTLCVPRNEIKDLTHDHIDSKSSERVTDYIISKIR
jgi:CDP-glycerol glycerophosphotransferase (TagB/SpsB family)